MDEIWSILIWIKLIWWIQYYVKIEEAKPQSKLPAASKCFLLVGLGVNVFLHTVVQNGAHAEGLVLLNQRSDGNVVLAGDKLAIKRHLHQLVETSLAQNLLTQSHYLRSRTVWKRFVIKTTYIILRLQCVLYSKKYIVWWRGVEPPWQFDRSFYFWSVFLTSANLWTLQVHLAT